MPEVTVQVGARLHNLSPLEVRGEIDSALRAQREQLRGIKVMELPQLQGVASGSALSLGLTGAPVGPRPGYIWSVMRLLVSGLTAGTTPDVVSFFKNSNAPASTWWQLNGNSFAATFGRLTMVMYGGDQLVVQSVGSFAATGAITVSGTLIECPQEMAAELI